MGAFNSRLKPKEIWGMPMAAAIGLVVLLIFTVLSLMLPWWLKVFTVPVAIGALMVAAVTLFFGDGVQWLGVQRLGLRVENRRVSSEITQEEE